MKCVNRKMVAGAFVRRFIRPDYARARGVKAPEGVQGREKKTSAEKWGAGK
jgi:hypothetical protein